MSRIAASHVIIPGKEIPVIPYRNEYYGEPLTIPSSKRLLLEERQAALPDRKVYRSMSRAGVLLSLACLELQPALKPLLAISPFSVGIYCALENGPVDLKSTFEMSGVSEDDYADRYRKSHNPKMFLMQLPNLAAAQMGVFLGIMGPMNVFNSSSYGSIHALQQAEEDLAEGRIDAALVCSAFSFENPLVLERIRRQNLSDRVLCEGAAAMLLEADGKQNLWLDEYSRTDSYYGISHQLIIQIINKGRNKC
ncbi:MAG: hypothetical protein HGA62_09175 [Chlorobiaceae bacterium]|nr:hypothetical protein [Chlorobiaceae bacterium]NTV60400.1 hypothetical protein [Chlorobiaceae bacterium]